MGLGELAGAAGDRGLEVVWQDVAAVLYGTSLFVIALWPLAYLTHALLATDVRWWRRP
jgi:hypothetical protein